LTGVFVKRPVGEEMDLNPNFRPEDEVERGVKGGAGSMSGSLVFLKRFFGSRGVFFNFMKAVFVFLGRWFQSFKKGLFSSGFGKDKILSLLVLIIFVLIVGLVITSSNQSKRENLAELDEILNSVQTRIAEAETRGGYDKEGAQMTLDKAYEDAKKVLESGNYRDKAGIYLLQIEETRDRLDNVIRVENPKVLADLTASRSDISALGFAVLGDRIFVYEANGLYEIVLDKVQPPLTISDDEIVVSATGFADRNSILFLTRTGKLIEFREGIMSFLNTEDGAFRRGTSLVAWGSRIYILDTVENQIWRYAYRGLREIFSPAEPYISDETDISEVVDFAIDANVYALKNDGGLVKFYAGRKQDFFVNNASMTMFKSPDAIYTNDKLDQIFVLDSGAARVLIYDKEPQTGNIRYTSQYVFDDVSELRDIYVDPNSKRIYLLSPNKILELEISR
jgi:hypothetical protein